MILADLRKALLDMKVYSYITFHVVFGQKPLDRGGLGSMLFCPRQLFAVYVH